MKNNKNDFEQMLIDSQESHFEFVEHNPTVNADWNHADIFDSANNVAIPGIPVSIGGLRDVAGKIGSIFSKHEDTSLSGFNRYMSSNNRLPFYPSKEEMIKAAQLGHWESVEPAAIMATYDPQNGTWARGDWRFLVISTNPITVKTFKGNSESHILNSPVNAIVPMVTAPSMASAQTPLTQNGAGASSGSGFNSSVGVNQPNSHILAGDVGGLNLFKNLSPTMSAGLILGFLAIVALVIWFANK